MLYFSTRPPSCSNFCEKSLSQNDQSSWGETLVWELHRCLVPSCFHQACRPPVYSAESLYLFLCTVWIVKSALISCRLNHRAVTGYCFARNCAQQDEPCPKFLNKQERQRRRYGYFPCGMTSRICQGTYRNHVLEGRNESGSPKTPFSSITVRYTSFILASNCSRVATPWVILGQMVWEIPWEMEEEATRIGSSNGKEKVSR